MILDEDGLSWHSAWSPFSLQASIVALSSAHCTELQFCSLHVAGLSNSTRPSPFVSAKFSC